MQSLSQIEKFLRSLNIDIEEIVELLPFGIIIIDENFKIKATNENVSEYFGSYLEVEEIKNLDLISRNKLSELLPLKNILLLKNGKYFQKPISFVENEKLKYVLVKGIPLIKNKEFKGGMLILDDYNIEKPHNYLNSDYSQQILDLLSKISNHILILDLDGKINAASESSSRRPNIFLNCVGVNISEYLDNEKEQDIPEIIEKVIFTKSTAKLKLYISAEGEQTIFNSVFVPLIDNNDNVEKIIVLMRETNNNELDNLGFLCDSQEFGELKNFVEIENDSLFRINLHGNVTYWPEKSSKHFSISTEDIISKFIASIFPEITKEYFEEIRTNIIKAGKWEGYLISNIRNDSELYKVKIISKLNEYQTELFVFCNLLNDQERNIIFASEEEKQFFRNVVINSNQVIFQINTSGTILFTNNKFSAKFGFELDEVLGRNFIDLIDSEFRNKNSIFSFNDLININNLEVIPLVDNRGNIVEVCFYVNRLKTKSNSEYYTLYCTECSLKDKLFLQTAHSLLYKYNYAVAITYDGKIIKVNPKFCNLFNTEFETDFYNKDFKKLVDENYHEELNYFLSNEDLSSEFYLDLIKNDGSTFKAKLEKVYSSPSSSFSVFIIRPKDEIAEKVMGTREFIQHQFNVNDKFFWSGVFNDEDFQITFIDDGLVNLVSTHKINEEEKQSFFTKFVHPDDQERLSSLFKLSNYAHKQSETVLIRLINKTGSIHWVKLETILKSTSDKSQKKLYGQIVDVNSWVSEREELKSIIEELDRLNTAKEKFISIISHDLKSPFTSIVGFSELILSDSTLEKEEILEFVANIKEASLHTIDLLNSLLDLTRLQTGRIDVQARTVNVNNITSKCVEILSGLALQKGIKLNANIDKSLFVMADDNLIFQVFNNLVANAIKFTPSGGEIDISAREIPNQQKIEFKVKDTGVGIDEDDIKKLFVIDKKFTTLGTEGERGTGLGLNLVYEIIKRHNGKIWVNSEVGKGSEFVFTLPISSPSILIINANKAQRVLYCKLLESITRSIEIIGASDENDAVKLIRKKKPMLIILEHNLNNITGLDFIEELIKKELNYKPGYIVLSEKVTGDLKELYEQIDVDYVFPKPFDLKEFRAVIDYYTGESNS